MKGNEVMIEDFIDDRKIEDILEKAANPPYGGEFRYGDRGGHGWSPFKGDELIRAMAAHIFESAPDAPKDWIY